MRVLLRNTNLGLYYAGPGRWVSSAAKALDFQETALAAKFARQAKRGELQVFLDYEGVTNPGSESGCHTGRRRS